MSAPSATSLTGASSNTPAVPDRSLAPLQAPLQEIERVALRTRFVLGERVFFVGHTGSGKTTLATRAIETITPWRLPVIVVDPKHEFHGAPGMGWEVVEDLPHNWERATARKRNPLHLRLIVQPEFYADPTKNESLNSMYRRIFERGRVLLYLDEIQRLCRNNIASPELSQLVQMGRAKFISVWGSTLRPAAIPRMFISESDHVFTFRLRDKSDRDRISEVIGERGKESPGPGSHDFFYRPPGTEALEPLLVHQ
jgi:hypothetical protein